MNAFEAFELAHCIKLHFTSDSYDYFKYQGKSNLKPSNFETRNDRYHYFKLSKQADPLGLLIANNVDGKVGWIGNLFSEPNMKIYREWCKRKESITYTFQTDMRKLQFPPDRDLQVYGGGYPSLLKMYQRKEVCIESLILLNMFLNFFPYWNAKIDDSVIWPSIYRKCMKYAPFLEFNPDKIKDVIADLR